MWRSGQDRIGRKVSQVPRDALQHGGGGLEGAEWSGLNCVLRLWLDRLDHERV